jgi:ABC-2 type transport system permease protein
MLKIKHTPLQLLDVTLTPILFTLLFTHVFGGAVAGSPGDYLQYLLPGLLVQSIIFITVFTAVVLKTDSTKGLYERFRSLPIWQASPLFGPLVGDLIRYVVAATLILLVGVIIGFRPAGGVVGVVLGVGVVFAFAFALSLLWIVIAMLMPTPETVGTTSYLVLMPATFASDIFVQTRTMPDWLRPIVDHNPITLLASATRKLMHGQPATSDVVWVLAASGIIVLVAAPIAMRLYRREH